MIYKSVHKNLKIVQRKHLKTAGELRCSDVEVKSCINA